MPFLKILVSWAHAKLINANRYIRPFTSTTHDQFTMLKAGGSIFRKPAYHLQLTLISAGYCRYNTAYMDQNIVSTIFVLPNCAKRTALLFDKYHDSYIKQSLQSIISTEVDNRNLGMLFNIALRNLTSF